MAEFFMLSLVAGLMIISPGPDFAVVVSNSLRSGRYTGISTALGIAGANLCHVTINLLGLGIIISQSVLLFTVIKFLGAAYLIYLGYKGLRAKPTLRKTPLVETNEDLKNINDQNGFYSGFVTSLLNPKACLFFLSFFSVILSPNTEITTQVFYGVWISIMAFFWFTLVAIFFTNAAISRKMQEVKHWLERVTGSILILLGIRLLGSEM